MSFASFNQHTFDLLGKFHVQFVLNFINKVTIVLVLIRGLTVFKLHFKKYKYIQVKQINIYLEKREVATSCEASPYGQHYCTAV